MNVLRMSDLDLKGKRVLIRVDLNAPIASDGSISNDLRLRAVVPTIKLAKEKGAKIMLLSHLGRPTEGEFDPSFSLQPVAKRLSELLSLPVHLCKLDDEQPKADEIVLFENVRFNSGEKANDDSLAQRYAALCDIFVHDAFGTAHRAQASTHGVARFAPLACAGPLLAAELDALSQATESPKKPVVAIVGGAKVSGKLEVLTALAKKVDQLIVGGGIANTFLAAQGHQIGASLYEKELIPTATDILQILDAAGASMPLPLDVKVAKEFSASAKAELKQLSDLEADDMILDIGPESIAALGPIIANAGTIVWNGPLGVFEFDAFSEGTKALAKMIGDSPAFSLAGGGDTLAAVEQFGVSDKISYISTGGGAFLEFLEGKKLPALAILEEMAAKCST